MSNNPLNTYHLRFQSVDERFWAKVVKSEGCWIWQSYTDKNGYGTFWVNKRYIRAHRWAWEAENGPIAEGLVIDHLCRVTSCVRPSHMEVVTSRTNTLRGQSLQAKNAQKTHCSHGHPFSQENTYLWPRKMPNGTTQTARLCRTCNRERMAIWRQKH